MQNDNLTDESSDSENSDSDDEEGNALYANTFPSELIGIFIIVLNGRYKNVSQLEWDNTTM